MYFFLSNNLEMFSVFSCVKRKKADKSQCLLKTGWGNTSITSTHSFLDMLIDSTGIWWFLHEKVAHCGNFYFPICFLTLFNCFLCTFKILHFLWVNTISISLRRNFRFPYPNFADSSFRYEIFLWEVWQSWSCLQVKELLKQATISAWKLSFFSCDPSLSQQQIGACRILGQYFSHAPSSVWRVEAHRSAVLPGISKWREISVPTTYIYKLLTWLDGDLRLTSRLPCLLGRYHKVQILSHAVVKEAEWDLNKQLLPR